MGNWFSHQPQTDHEKLTLFWKHNKEGKVYAGDDSFCTNEWDRYEVGKQLCDFNDIVNYEINNVLTIHVAYLLEDQIPYKSLLKFASNWSIDQVEICFISIRTLLSFVRDFTFVRIGQLKISADIDPLGYLPEWFDCEGIKHNFIKRIQSNELNHCQVYISGAMGYYRNVCDIKKGDDMSENFD